MSYVRGKKEKMSKYSKHGVFFEGILSMIEPTFSQHGSSWTSETVAWRGLALRSTLVSAIDLPLFPLFDDV